MILTLAERIDSGIGCAADPAEADHDDEAAIAGGGKGRKRVG